MCGNKREIYDFELEVLRLVFSDDDDIVIDIPKMKLTINDIEIPLNNSTQFVHKTLCYNRINLVATINDDSLIVNLPFHGLLLKIRSTEDLLFKVRPNYHYILLLLLRCVFILGQI